MAGHDPEQPIGAALEALVEWLDHSGVPYVVVGGIAASVLGRPRFTQDIDALIYLADADWESFLRSADPFGIGARSTDYLKFVRENRVLLLVHKPTAVKLDLIAAGLPYEMDVIQSAARREVLGSFVPLPRLEDLIIMKVMASRARDMADVEGLADANGPLNWDYITTIIGQFGEALADSEMVQTVQRLRKRFER